MEISPGNGILFHPIPAESTGSIILEKYRDLGLHNDVLAHPISQPLIQFVYLSTEFCSLASFSAYLTVNHLATY